MATQTIDIPTFDFVAFYYPELLDALMAFKRENVPELTDESDHEPLIQLIRAFALVGHINNVNIDIAANESTLPTAKLVETVRNMLRLIDYELSPAAPAQVDIVYELSRTFAGSFEVVPTRAQCATKRTVDALPIPYEADAAVSVSATDAVGYSADDDGGVITDRTTAVNDPLAASDFTPWGGVAAVQDKFIVAHPDVMFDRVDFEIPVNGAGFVGVWEFYDNDFLEAVPDSVTVTATLRVFLNGWLGASDKTGTEVRVTLNATGANEDAVVQYSGGQNFVDVGLLGQSSPSSDPADYSVGSDWSELTVLSDGTNGFTESGAVTFQLPQTVFQYWKKWENDLGANVYAIRFRVVTAGATAPTIRRVQITEGKQYVLQQATQGRSVNDVPLGSSTGLADQRFTLSSANHISGSQVITVGGTPWTEVDTFLNSAPTSEHYRVELGEDDTAIIIFGSGNQGKIPPIGSNNIAATLYRVDANEDGNVGANTIVVDKSGLTFVSALFNPRQAVGWSEAEGSTEASLERAKLAGPAQLRVIEVALGPDDVVTLMQAYTDESGAKPFSRGVAIEEGLGPKTVELVVVAKGGALATQTQLDALSLYFNGDSTATPPLPKRIVANQEVTAFNHSQKSIDVEAVVYTTASAEAIENALRVLLKPEALKADGVTYEWSFGSEVPRSRLNHEIFEVDESTTKVDLIQPAADVPLGTRELPIDGNITITVLPP